MNYPNNIITQIMQHAVAYAENFRGGPNFVTIVWRRKPILREVGACPRVNFAKLHLKIRIFVHSGSTF